VIRAALGCALFAGLFAGCNAVASQDEQIAADVSRAATQVDTIDADTLATRIAAGGVKLIDVRTPEEFADGHIAGAVNMPVETFDPARLADADPTKTVLYCRSGRRSQVAAGKLAAATDKTAVHLDGGILAWEAAGQPVVR
jgi:rhodanese-related sulfurtransferase